MMIQDKLKQKKGFTLVETLVAIAVITVVMGAPFYAAVRSLNAAQNARDELTANMLAQEGIEYVIYQRDNNYLTNYYGTTREWLYGLDGTGGPNCIANKCTVDPAQASLVACSGACTAPLYITPTGWYTQQSAGNTKTRFTRWVQITTTNAHEVKVQSTVTWTTNQIPYTTTITEYLQNWL